MENKPAGPVVIRLGIPEFLGITVIGVLIWLCVTGNIKITNTPAQASQSVPTTTSTVPSDSDILSLASNQKVDAVTQPTPIPLPELDREVPPLRTTDFVSTGTQPSSCELDPDWPQAVQQWCGWLTQYAPTSKGYNANWAAAQVWQESKGNKNAQGRSCEPGLLQVMPSDGIGLILTGNSGTYFQCDPSGTHENYVATYGHMFDARPTMAELFNPEFNIAFAMNKVAAGLETRNVYDTLVAYNGGTYYADVVTKHYNCIVNNDSASCTGGLK